MRLDAASQEVVPVDEAAFQGELVSINSNGRVTFRIGEKDHKKGETRNVATDGLVRWGNPVAPRPQTIVVLADGGQIVTAADWAGGAAVRLDDKDLLLLSDSWNEVRLPRELVSGIVFAQANRAEEREKLAEQVRDEIAKTLSNENRASAADAVLLTNGDRLAGKLKELERGSLAIETAGTVASLPLSRVEAIAFGNSRQPQGRRKWAVGLRDGSLVYATAARAATKDCEIELASGVHLKGPAGGDIIFIQSFDGKVVYLSDMEGGDYRYVPYLSLTWPYTRDRNVLNQPISVRGRRYLKGIGMHSASRLTYRFDESFRRYDAAVAIDDSAKGRGSVVFGVYLLRDGTWAEAYKSPIVRGDDAPLPVSVDLHGSRGVTLTVDFADRGDELDHGVWLDARLIR